MPAPVFSCPHTEHQFDIRDPVVFVFVLWMFPYEVILRLSCVVYFLMVEKAESSFGTSPAGVEYVRAVSLCSPLFFSFFYITSRRAFRPASRFACRRSSRLGVSSCVSSCVPFCVSFVRLVCASRPALPSGVFRAMSSRPACRYASRSASRFHCLSAGHDLTFVRGAVSFCLPLAVSSWRLVLGVCVSALYAAIASRFSSRHAVSCSMPFLVSVLRFRSVSCHCVPLFCLPVGCDFHEAPFRLARRSSYAMPNDPDETRREVETMRWNETREAGRRARRGRRDEERKAKAKRSENSFFWWRLIYRRRFVLPMTLIPFRFSSLGSPFVSPGVLSCVPSVPSCLACCLVFVSCLVLFSSSSVLFLLSVLGHGAIEKD